ncbi:hypothetical protein ACFVJM_25815 [Streptomyces virginiae]|uniref:hypothetical protein n=1 Tax=Streptomyces virginiae TaxID=1961 RepID=UPI00363BF6BA
MLVELDGHGDGGGAGPQTCCGGARTGVVDDGGRSREQPGVRHLLHGDEVVAFCVQAAPARLDVPPDSRPAQGRGEQGAEAFGVGRDETAEAGEDRGRS